MIVAGLMLCKFAVLSCVNYNRMIRVEHGELRDDYIVIRELNTGRLEMTAL